MSELMTRRETIRMGLAGSLVALVPEWALPALAQGEMDVPFTDVPATFNPSNRQRRTTGSSTCGRSTASSRRPISSSSSSTTTSRRSTPPRYRLKLTGLVEQADRAVAGRSSRR